MEVLLPTSALHDDIAVMKLLSQLGPEVKVKVYGFTIELFDRRITPVITWNQTWKFIQERHRLTCHWLNFNQYFEDNTDKINVMVTITHPSESEPGVVMDDTNLTAFSVGIFQGTAGYIAATCGREFASKIQQEKFGVEKVQLKIGLLARCLMINYLLQQGVGEIYNDAAAEGLVKYYSSLGFRLGKENCNKVDPITELHNKYIIEGKSLDDLLKELPADYKNIYGYRMKLCSNTDPICLGAIASLRDFQRILELYNDVYWYGAVW